MTQEVAKIIDLQAMKLAAAFKRMPVADLVELRQLLLDLYSSAMVAQGTSAILSEAVQRSEIGPLLGALHPGHRGAIVALLTRDSLGETQLLAEKIGMLAQLIDQCLPALPAPQGVS